MNAPATWAILCLFCATTNFGYKYDPEEDMDPYQLIASKGYPVEDHEIGTTDGYRLSLQRILRGRHEPPSNASRPVVFLQHGLLGSSTDWLTNLANESLGFILADGGFEVWLGNFRGNTYSKRHATLNPSQEAFWQFSWDEMADLDLEAMINKALEISGSSQLYYVGHSEGTLTAFAKFSSDLNFAKKVKHFFALAPVYHVGHIEGLVRYIAPLASILKFMDRLFGNGEFMPSTKTTKFLAKFVCGFRYTNPLCDNILFLVAGYDSIQLNETRVPVYAAHSLAGTSVQNMVHFGQMVKTGLCQKYDWGTRKENNAHYGQPTPPSYNVSNMKVPVSIFSGGQDWLADPTDVEALRGKLKSLVNDFTFKDFNHLDFIWGMRAPDEVYNKIIDIMRKEEHWRTNVVLKDPGMADGVGSLGLT